MNLLPLLLLSLLAAATPPTAPRGPVLNIILMGATGNLAQKYLWQGLFNIHAAPTTDKHAPRLAMWPAATKPASVSQPLMDGILKGNVTYAQYPVRKTDFLERVAQYHQLLTKPDFEALQSSIHQRSKLEREVGRIIYLSVPPKVFGSIAAEINANLRPIEGGWLKVIVEKPFGVDLASAQQLSRDLFHSLKADEVLLVDHYMGKFGLEGIREFHALNPLFHTDVLTRARVASVLVSMVETEDVKGRTWFYDEVGVVRDTMQNHLMMMTTLLAMRPSKDEPAARLEVAKAVRQPRPGDIKQIAQYASYIAHVKSDQNKTQVTSHTPTYARLVLTLASDLLPLADVPIVFSSGKALGTRRAYVAVNFKDGNQLVFNVQGKFTALDGAQVEETAIYATKGLPQFKAPAGWLVSSPRLAKGPGKNAPSAYEVLLKEVIQGHFESFVQIPEVLESWRFWDEMLKLVAKAPLESYEHGGEGLFLKLDEPWPNVDNFKKPAKSDL